MLQQIGFEMVEISAVLWLSAPTDGLLCSVHPQPRGYNGSQFGGGPGRKNQALGGTVLSELKEQACGFGRRRCLRLRTQAPSFSSFAATEWPGSNCSEKPRRLASLSEVSCLSRDCPPQTSVLAWGDCCTPICAAWPARVLVSNLCVFNAYCGVRTSTLFGTIG